MSLHQSLKSGAGLARSRNVLTRLERLERLKELGKWAEERDSVFGLPKTRAAIAKKFGKKRKKEKKAEKE